LFCSFCGKTISPQDVFCPYCGTNLLNQSPSNPFSLSYLCSRLSFREKLSGIVWACVSVSQLLIGLSSGLWTVVCMGIWNAIGAYQNFRQAQKVLLPYPGLVQEYRNQLVSILVFLVINAALGGFIGIAGCIFDFMTRHFVLKNQAAFQSSPLS